MAWLTGGSGELHTMDTAGCGAHRGFPQLLAVGQLQCLLPLGPLVSPGLLHALPQGRWPLHAGDLRSQNHRGICGV